MAQKFGTYDLVNNADMGSSFMSEPINLVKKFGFSVHATFTGAPNGSTFIAVSIDNIKWILLPDSTKLLTEAGDIFYNVNDSKYVSARFHFSFSSGSGTCNATYSTKESI